MLRRNQRRKGDGLPHQFHSGIATPRLMRDDPKIVQHIRVARLHRENLPVNRLRLRQPPGLVVLERKLEYLINGHTEGLEHCLAHHARHISR